MIKESVESKEQVFQSAPPSLFKTNSDTICAFSMFKEKKDQNPVLYLHSLEQKQTIRKIDGGEFFIDYVPNVYS